MQSEHPFSKTTSYASTILDCGEPFKPRSTLSKGRLPLLRRSGMMSGQVCAKVTAVCRGAVPSCSSSQSALPRHGRITLAGVLLAPFRTRTAHVMELRLIGLHLVGHHRLPNSRYGGPDFQSRWGKAGRRIREQLTHLNTPIGRGSKDRATRRRGGRFALSGICLREGRRGDDIGISLRRGCAKSLGRPALSH